MWFGLFGSKRKRSQGIQDRLDALTVQDKELRLEEKRERLADRRKAREYAEYAVANNRPDLLAVVDLLHPDRTQTRPFVPPAESRSDRIVDVLLTRALADPEEQMERMHEAALRRRQLLRELEEDDDEGHGGKAGFLRELAPLVPLVLMAMNPQLAATAGPAIMASLNPSPPATPEPTAIPPAPVLPAPPVAAMPAAMPAPTGPEAFSPDAVLAHLQTMVPSVFAAWLVAQPAGANLVQQLVLTPEDQLETQMRNAVLAARLPLSPLGPWAVVLDWLASHPTYALQVAAALRGSVPGAPSAPSTVRAVPRVADLDDDDEDDEEQAI